MKKSANKIIFAAALIAGIAFMSGYAVYTCKKTVSDITCSQKSEKPGEQKILQSDLPFLESLTRHFLILYH